MRVYCQRCFIRASLLTARGAPTLLHAACPGQLCKGRVASSSADEHTRPSTVTAQQPTCPLPAVCCCQGSIFTAQGAQLMLPYLTVASVHWYLAAHWRQWPRWRGLANPAIEACYSAICMLSMPSWVLHGSITDAKAFLRMFILGSGILIGYWCRFLTPTFFVRARWLIPLQFLFQAWHLTGPTCAAVEAYPYGAAAAREVSATLDSLAATSLPSCPGVHSCHHIGYLLEFVAGLLLLYMQYRLEAANRSAYLQGRAQAVKYWPHVPGYVQAALHLLLSLQASSAIWTVLQCRAARLTIR
ncbi:hypothetical protein COO60DRAFT_1478089 [Scenedesmus sp. NREL 46B-D3]|nr:hypothetical protein COO60DRAFT_1478089 [Scenedesmus sp. NREL 46B-D3]